MYSQLLGFSPFSQEEYRHRPVYVHVCRPVKRSRGKLSQKDYFCCRWLVSTPELRPLENFGYGLIGVNGVTKLHERAFSVLNMQGFDLCMYMCTVHRFIMYLYFKPSLRSCEAFKFTRLSMNSHFNTALDRIR